MEQEIRIVEPFESPMERARREGHRRRTGHESVRVLVSGDGILWHGVDLCCGETVEQKIADGLTTWVEMTPAQNPIIEGE